jgi:hypothetical protein
LIKDLSVLCSVHHSFDPDCHHQSKLAHHVLKYDWAALMSLILIEPDGFKSSSDWREKMMRLFWHFTGWLFGPCLGCLGAGAKAVIGCLALGLWRVQLQLGST